MKRLLILALLVILPYQFSWATAAGYCEHENASIGHFGHHTHQIDADYHDKLGDDKQITVHGDCSYCQATAVQASIFLPAKQAVIPPARSYTDIPPVSFTSHIPEGPRRPDRPPVA